MTPYSSESVSSACGTAPPVSYSVPMWISSVASPPSSTIESGPEPSGQVSICSVHHQYSSSVSPFQAKTGDALRVLRRAVRADDDRGGGVVLGGEDVAADPAHVGAERDEGLDQDGGLHGHVQRAGDLLALQRLRRTELAAQRHQAGHLVLGEADLLAAEVGQREVGDLEVVDGAGGVGGQGDAHVLSWMRGGAVMVSGARCRRWPGGGRCPPRVVRPSGAAGRTTRRRRGRAAGSVRMRSSKAMSVMPRSWLVDQLAQPLQPLDLTRAVVPVPARRCAARRPARPAPDSAASAATIRSPRPPAGSSTTPSRQNLPRVVSEFSATVAWRARELRSGRWPTAAPATMRLVLVEVDLVRAARG